MIQRWENYVNGSLELSCRNVLIIIFPLEVTFHGVFPSERQIRQAELNALG